MPSNSLERWTAARARSLDKIEQAHSAVGGTGLGRRLATEQINQAYTLLLASQFQGFCRDFHSECLAHLVLAVVPGPLQAILRTELKRNRLLDRGNAHRSSLGADFGRLGIDFWTEVKGFDLRNERRSHLLDELNSWRNAIAHQDFEPEKLGVTTLSLARVRSWRAACRGLALGFDEVMRRHLLHVSGNLPW